MGVVLLLAAAVMLPGAASAAEPYAVRWKLASAGNWPPAVIGANVVVKSGDVLAAHDVATGRQVWTHRLSNLRYGEGVLAGGERYVYVLADAALIVLEGASGRVVRTRPIASPTSVLYQAGSIYVTGGEGVWRFDAAAETVLQRAPQASGELRGADGHFVVLYRHLPDTDPRVSPKRLVVIDLRSGQQRYEFKLLRLGWHRVARVSDGRIVFIDYTQRARDGSNPRKLYYTEADYLRSRKVKDLALGSRYGSAASDTFWIARGDGGVIYLASHGAAADPSTVLALNPTENKTLWTKTGMAAGMGLLLHDGRLWTGVATKDEAAQAVAYGARDGQVLFRQELDAPGTGTPVAAGAAVLLRTRQSIYCFAPRLATAAAPPPSPKNDPPRAPPAAPLAGWREFRDTVAGYTIKLPATWSYDRPGLRKLGGVRFVVPFLRAGVVGGRPATLGTLHLLTYEAAGRDADGLWRSVHYQRQRTNPELRVTRVTRVANVGGSGASGILAVYTFHSRGGYAVQLRSLCVVSHGVAFEVRAWAGPFEPETVWREVDGVLATFRPQRF